MYPLFFRLFQWDFKNLKKENKKRKIKSLAQKIKKKKLEIF